VGYFIMQEFNSISSPNLVTANYIFFKKIARVRELHELTFKKRAQLHFKLYIFLYIFRCIIFFSMLYFKLKDSNDTSCDMNLNLYNLI